MAHRNGDASRTGLRGCVQRGHGRRRPPQRDHEPRGTTREQAQLAQEARCPGRQRTSLTASEDNARVEPPIHLQGVERKSEGQAAELSMAQLSDMEVGHLAAAAPWRPLWWPRLRPISGSLGTARGRWT